MIRVTLALALIGATAYAAPAKQPYVDRDEARIAERLSKLVPGAPVDCISPSASDGGQHAGNVVLMKDRSGVLYTAHFEGGCQARDSDALISRRPTTRVCRGDIVEIRDLTSGFSSGACSYSSFTPYRRPR